MNNKAKVRNSTFEILRIVAIIFIIISHYMIAARDSGTASNEIIILANNFVLGDIGVALFMFISGFFLRKSERIDPWHIVKIVLEYYFYIFLLYGLSFAFTDKAFSSDELLNTFLSLFLDKLWFVPAYLLVYIFHPFINKLFKDDNYKLSISFMITITIVWSIIPSFTAATFYLNRFLSVLCLYCYGAFLKQAKDTNQKWFNKKTGWLLFLINFGIIFIFQLVMSLVSITHIDMAYMISWFISRHSIFMILMISGLMILIAFAKPLYSRVINFLAAYTLGIYLLHEYDGLKNYYWYQVFRVQNYCFDANILWHLLMCVSLIFFIGLAVDVIRKYALETPLFMLIKKIASKFKHKEQPVEA